MFHLVIRQALRLQAAKNFDGFCFIRLSSSQKTKLLKSNESNEEELHKIESAVAVPVQILPTVDSSKRNSPNVLVAVTNSEKIATEDELLNKVGEKVTNKRHEDLAWMITPSQEKSKLLHYYLMLSKFRLTSLVVITSMAGYAVAPAPFEITTFILCSAGTGLLSAAANSINQYHEVPFDAQMSRTKNRVLVRGLVTPAHAIGFAIGAASTGLGLLYFGVNGLTASLGMANLVLYTSIYTPMKRFSILNTWIGSIVGAIPPLMGWAGCAGTLDAGAWILGGLLYAWQFPHFNALSWNLRADYSRAGYRMMSVTDPALCRRTALRYTAVLGALSLVAPYYDVTNIWFALETLPLNAYFGYLAWKFYKNSDSGSSRKLFRFSLIHLPALMLLFLLNKKRWIFSEQNATEAATVAVALNSAEPNVYDLTKPERTVQQISNLPNSSYSVISSSSPFKSVIPITVSSARPDSPELSKS